jgi:hypothetical protein
MTLLYSCTGLYIGYKNILVKNGDCKKTVESFVSYRSPKVFQKIIFVEFRSLWNHRTVDDRKSCWAAQLYILRRNDEYKVMFGL